MCFQSKRRHINQSQESVHIFMKLMRSNHLTRFRMESKGLGCWQVINYVAYSTQTQTCEHTHREVAAAAAKVGALLPYKQCSIPVSHLEDHLMLILPPCVMHIYYKTKHLQILVLLAPNMLFLIKNTKNPMSRVTFTKLFVQLEGASEILFMSGVLAQGARAQRLVHINTQRRDRFIKMWTCCTRLG